MLASNTRRRRELIQSHPREHPNLTFKKTGTLLWRCNGRFWCVLVLTGSIVIRHCRTVLIIRVVIVVGVSDSSRMLVTPIHLQCDRFVNGTQ
jgi:hypothetical protein